MFTVKIIAIYNKRCIIISVALNDTACQVLKEQIGNHHKWVFVHTESKKRPDGTLTPSVRKMRVDSNTAWRAALKRAGIENFRCLDLRHSWAGGGVPSGVPGCHLAPNHLTEHAKQIDSIFGTCVPNTSHLRKVENLK